MGPGALHGAPGAKLITPTEAETVNGLATISYRIDRDGIFEVTAASGSATISSTLVLNTQGGLAQVIMPTPTPTIQPTPTASLQPTQTPPADPTKELRTNTTGFPSMMDWFLSR